MREFGLCVRVSAFVSAVARASLSAAVADTIPIDCTDGEGGGIATYGPPPAICTCAALGIINYFLKSIGGRALGVPRGLSGDAHVGPDHPDMVRAAGRRMCRAIRPHMRCWVEAPAGGLGEGLRA